MRTELLRFNGAVERDPAIDAWMKGHAGELGAIAQQWFEVMRKCGDEVRELLHDGCPVACLGDAPFGYVNVFTSHVNVGFFHGASLSDPARLLQGNGKSMRHVLVLGRALGWVHTSIPVATKMVEYLGDKTGAWMTTITYSRRRIWLVG